MTAVICSAATGDHTRLLDLAEPSLKRYAADHGYDLHCEREFAHIGRPASWYKLLLLRQLLDDYDTAIWVDADAMFVRYDRNIADVAPASRPLWMAKHRVEGRDHLLPNCGVLVVHRHPTLSDFFDRVWEQTEYVEHPWWEQAAILHLLGYKIERPGGLAWPGGETEWTPLVGFFGTEWNSMPHDPHPDPHIKHFSGMPFMTRLTLMQQEAECN